MNTVQANKLITNFNLQSRYFRRALRMAIAVLLAVFIYRYFSLTQGFWLPLTVVIIMQATTAATLRKGLQRFLGTLVGIILGSLLVLKISNPILIDFLLILFLFLAYYLKAFNLVNYGIFVIPLTVMVVFLVSALVPQESHHLILARLYDTTLGAILGIVITLFVFPNNLQEDIDSGIKKTILVQNQFLQAIFKLMLKQIDKQYSMQKRLEFEECLTLNRALFSNWIYELWFKLELKHRHERILVQLEKLGQFLFALHHLAKQDCPETLSKQLTTILIEALQLTEQAEASYEKNNHDLFSLKQQLMAINTIKNNITTKDNLVFIATLLVNLENYQQSISDLHRLLNPK